MTPAIKPTTIIRHFCSAIFGAILLITHAPAKAAQPRPLLLTHYMPWFESKPFSGKWGWHWTMNHYNPDNIVNGRQDAASNYRPLIGLYDSSDPDTLQCQVLLMKIAGIDGVIVDWYGTDNLYDYADNNAHTQRLIPFLQKAGLKFAICYETQTIPAEIKANVLQQPDTLDHGRKLFSWIDQNFFSQPNYLRINAHPLLLNFGDPYYNDDQWNQIFSVLKTRPAYITENTRRLPTASLGGFDWPIPTNGTASGLAEDDNFNQQAKAWPLSIATAYPRFDDMYAQAGVGHSWGHIDDQNGQTFEQTLTKALDSSSEIVQLVTWNDWGEGTQIEPSVENGYQDLEIVQRMKAQYFGTKSEYTSADLRLPVQWYLLRKHYADNASASAELARVPSLIIKGKMARARAILSKYNLKAN